MSHKISFLRHIHLLEAPREVIHNSSTKEVSSYLCILDVARTVTIAAVKSYCKTGWAGIPNSCLLDEPIEVVDKASYLDSCIGPDGQAKYYASIQIGKTRAAMMKLHHLWRRCDIILSVKGPVHNATVRCILLYGSKTWSLPVEDVRSSVFEDRCLRSILPVGTLDHAPCASQLTFCSPTMGRVEASQGKPMTWQRSTKASTSKNSRAGHIHLPGWGHING
ncbi:hypothetical protein CSKR_104465 [Clonorchis sinensis]|uniref:Uncharacterized protein n=1 Tax=Clonorchis sinensis TaxID=79923 RepID=A0A3R7H0Q6_CLOSI|nr:hypothetical protein CSKR_104465 [Clonorchis sinensis]